MLCVATYLDWRNSSAPVKIIFELMRGYGIKCRHSSEAAAITAVATATALAIQQVALAIQFPGEMEAVNLKVAEKYVDASGNAAKQGNILILPGNVADMGTTVVAAMRIDMTQK